MAMLRKRSAAKTVRSAPLEYVMSDSTPDRYGDVVEARGWNLLEFEENPVALVNHNADFICGRWTNVRVVGNQLRGHLELAPAGVSKRIDEVRTLVLGGFMPGASVGFLPIASAPRQGGGTNYLKQKLVECSIVATPANSNALLQRVKALGISDRTIDRVFKSPPSNGTLAERQAAAKAALARSREMARRRIKIEADEYDGLDAETIARIEIARMEEEHRSAADLYAHRQTDAFGNPPPSLTFCGRPAFRRKNKYGW